LFNVTVDTPIFTNTCILQFTLYLYNILWAFGIAQCVSVKHICNLGSVFFEGLRMTPWRSKHVVLSICYLMYMKWIVVLFTLFRSFESESFRADWRTDEQTWRIFIFFKSFYETPSEICLFPNPRTFMRAFPLSWLLVLEIWNVTNRRTNTAKYMSVCQFDLHKFITRNLSCYLKSVSTDYRNISFTIFRIPSSITSKQIQATNFPLHQLISPMNLEQRDTLNVNYLFKSCLYSLKNKTHKSCVCLHWKVRKFLRWWGKAQFKN
jgi:hypothetical protein